ncbi:Hemolysin-type calcium-binding repeat-containing protein [Pseudosulfitobacter pseudonitzschiae]|nr:calcium-binding protein [Pseudosulfitobacter pseudonitzschiae]QKS08449.1 M10 family metallopeptidase C-terminal domain-containing protein [Pseudosulfitobacter pseudonitzschiae]SHF74575.1 Hemolysin-type calcium-binding repeat-containing protein [Pseudosulfitobacter pseudonitzschiae]
MAVIVPSTTVTTGTLIGNADVADNDLVWIEESVSLVSTDWRAIEVSEQFLRVNVDGTVIGENRAIDLDSASTDLDYGYDITIGETGSVVANNDFAFYVGSNSLADDSLGSISVDNDGSITSYDRGTILMFLANTASLTNSGTITSNSDGATFASAVMFYAIGNAYLDNSGLIERTKIGGGEIYKAAVSFFAGTENVVAINSGTILSYDQAFNSDALVSETFTNTGEIYGRVELSDTVGGTFKNFGFVDGNVNTAGGADLVTNGGTISGTLDLGAGDDTYTASNTGLVTGGVLGGTGNDTLTGGNNADFLDGGADNDRLFGRGGDDDLRGGLGSDFMSGGMGDDQLIGDDGADKMFGGDGDDTLNGGRDQDTIRGGDGNDEINGGRLADVLRGGAGADTFLYTVKQDSSTGASDTIQDFEVGIDVIDLSAVASGLTFVGTAAFSGTGNEVRYDIDGSGKTFVQVDTDGNGSADMRIWLTDVGALSVDDFVL